MAQAKFGVALLSVMGNYAFSFQCVISVYAKYSQFYIQTRYMSLGGPIILVWEGQDFGKLFAKNLPLLMAEPLQTQAKPCI